jgi:hypothetical protein
VVTGVAGDDFNLLWTETQPPDPAIEFDTPQDLQIWGAEFVWSRETLRALLLAVADDREQAVFLSPENNQVFAPYDGGADVFLRDHQSVGSFKAEFAEWLSPREDGL